VDVPFRSRTRSRTRGAARRGRAGGGRAGCSTSAAAPFGELKRSDPGLAHGDEAGFAARVAARCTSFPEAYRRIKAANLGLERIDDWEAQELETGKNQCALAG